MPNQIRVLLQETVKTPVNPKEEVWAWPQNSCPLPDPSEPGFSQIRSHLAFWHSRDHQQEEDEKISYRITQHFCFSSPFNKKK